MRRPPHRSRRAGGHRLRESRRQVPPDAEHCWQAPARGHGGLPGTPDRATRHSASPHRRRAAPPPVGVPGSSGERLSAAVGRPPGARRAPATAPAPLQCCTRGPRPPTSRYSRPFWLRKVLPPVMLILLTRCHRITAKITPTAQAVGITTLGTMSLWRGAAAPARASSPGASTSAIALGAPLCEAGGIENGGSPGTNELRAAAAARGPKGAKTGGAGEAAGQAANLRLPWQPPAPCPCAAAPASVLAQEPLAQWRCVQAHASRLVSSAAGDELAAQPTPRPCDAPRVHSPAAQQQSALHDCQLSRGARLSHVSVSRQTSGRSQSQDHKITAHRRQCSQQSAVSTSPPRRPRPHRSPPPPPTAPSRRRPPKQSTRAAARRP